MTIDEIKRLKDAELPRFSVFAHDKLPLVGDKKRLGEILNRDIVITDFRVFKSKHQDSGECLQIQFLMDNNVFVLFSGSIVLISQIRDAAGQIPFRTQITKIDKYYSFV